MATVAPRRTMARPKLRRRRLRRAPLYWGDKRMTEAMVDRLFWRAGFGPTEADRTRWKGARLSAAVNWLLTTPVTLVGPPPTANGAGLDPLANDNDLVMQWVDRMVRADNPLPERMTFFWHRHFATSRGDTSAGMMLKHIGLMRSFADMAANPNANFRDLVQAVTIDPAMLRSLTGDQNVRGRPNENYARELMELFCLGITDAAGQPNYSEADVQELARAMSGWRIDTTNPANPTAYFTATRWDGGTKTVLGNTGAYTAAQAVDVVLSHRNHAPFLLRKLWGEFIQSAPDDATLADLVKTYNSRGRRLRPVLKKILQHRALFESVGEPNMLKAPVVYVPGVMRAMGLPVVNATPRARMQAMGQEPYFPPDVSGWEYGPAWLDTTTAIARFRLVADFTNIDVAARIDATDIANETPQQAFDRAYAAVTRPWLAPGTRARILDYANRAPGTSRAQRTARQRVLRSLMLGGPDGQVM